MLGTLVDTLVGVAIGLGALFGLFLAIMAGLYAWRGQKASIDATRAQNAIDSLETAMHAQEIEMGLLQTRVSAQDRTITSQTQTIAMQGARITELTESVTQRAAVEEFRDEARAWFRAIGAKVGVESPAA